jgi:calcium-dependent protein kinase
MVIELCRGGELFERLDKSGPLSEAVAARIIRQVLLAVAHIHQKGFVHTDLKLENILFASDDDDSDIKLIDLGFCQRCGPDEVLHRKMGSAGYMAPEVIKQSYANKCDLFSVGVIAYVLLSDRAPFGMGDVLKCEAKALAGSYKFGDRFKGVSSLAKEFVAALLVVDPEQRLSAAEALQHPWLASPSQEPQDNFIALGKQHASFIDLERASSEPSTRVPSVTGDSTRSP